MPHHKPLVPVDFQVPQGASVAGRFIIRPLMFSDAKPDYEAWRSSIEHLRGIFGPESDWPTAGMTLEDNAIDLAWHQREHETASSFAFTVLDPSQQLILGCVYINPSRKSPYDAEVFYWVRASEVKTGLESELGAFVRSWVANDWPFTKVVYPGRDVAWDEFGKLPDKEHW